jgi:hypothetical protein
MAELVLYEAVDKVGFVTLNRPEKLNALSPTFPTGPLILEFCRQKLNLFKGR